MPIDIKINANGYVRTAQPSVKLSTNQWTPLKQALVKTAAGWKEVWPSEIVYIHTGTGYNLNMHACFGYPTSPANYIFINDGIIGSIMNTLNWALTTGVFPQGSTVTLINNGYIVGSGGRGASFSSSGPGTGISQARPGSPGLLLQTPTIIQNNGMIGGGGGGGGCSGDFAGKSRYNFTGGGGAGQQPGSGADYTWGGNIGYSGTLTTGGSARDGGGHGGALGADGLAATRVVNNDYSLMSIGAPGGISIGNTSFILPGSTGLDGTTRLKGRATTSAAWIMVNSMSGTGNYGAYLYVNLSINPGNGSITGSWISGGGAIQVVRTSNTQFAFRSVLATSGRQNTWRAGVMRFTVSSAVGTDYIDVYIRVGDAAEPYDDYGGGCCFTGDSLITMADGSQNRIDEIKPGDWVKTPFGTSEVDWIRLPMLADRPLLAMDNGACKTSGEHCIWAKDPETGEQWWATRDMERWEFESIHELGPGLNGKQPTDLIGQGKTSALYATESGWRESSWTVVEEASPDTQLYHLYLKDHASYFVDGFLVIGELPRRETLIDWTQFNWDWENPQSPVYSVYDYELPEVDKSPFKRITLCEDSEE